MVWIWTGFIVFVLLMLALDLGVFHRNAHVVSMKEALGWSALWISLSLLFTIFIYFGYENHWLGLGEAVDIVGGVQNDGTKAAVKYLTGYLIEKSLSVDNIFVIAMVFGFLGVPSIYQHRVLFWGILGALVMRGVMIGVGASLVERYHWVLYVFGVFLIITAVKMLFVKRNNDPTDNVVVRTLRKLFPITDHFHGQHFLVRAGSDWSHEPEIADGEVVRDEAVENAKAGTLMLTPLAVALVIVETTDLLFALDSIPAIFAITSDPFIVFTSNVFAILGLRSLYFALAGLIEKFRYLKPALALILVVVGLKMLFAEPLKKLIGENFNFYLLGIILLVLVIAIVASYLRPLEDEEGTEHVD